MGFFHLGKFLLIFFVRINFNFRDNNDSVIRPLPRVKKILSQPILLYPIVQLLLTYDPAIVFRVAQLLSDVMQVC